jgi:outer membrane lipoprotein-sorting protein
MKIKLVLCLLLTALLVGNGFFASAQTQSTPPASELIKQFAAKESELREIWKEYTYQQESKLQVIGPAGIVSGELYQLSEFVFNDAGTRIQRILRAPMSTLQDAGLTFTAEDRAALIDLQPFSLTTEELPNYTVTLAGKEKIDDIKTYVFDVNPKVMTDQRALGKLKDQKVEGRYFQGKVWVDEQDMQVVKVRGKVVPEFKQRFPVFETYRENIDERFWLPTYTYADEVLNFEKGFSVHMRMVVRYKNYRRFSSDVKVTTGAEEPEEKKKPEKPEEKPIKKP